MTAVPAWLLPHRVAIRPLLGTNTYGEQYGPQVSDIPAMVSHRHVMTRDRTGAQVASTAQVIAGPDLACPVGSEITLPDGRKTKAISVGRHTAPGLPVPESTEVMCQ